MKLKADPILAVNDVIKSAQWYSELLNCTVSHEGGHFKILTDEDDRVLLCLHPWERDDHPTMRDKNITVGNGCLLYFRTDRMLEIRENAKKLGAKIEEDIHLNPNSGEKEFSLWDLDGYFIIISDYHGFGYGYT